MARPGFTDHPKFKRLVYMLQMPEPHVLGHVEYLWTVAYQNGEPVIGDAVDIELAAKWTGAAGVLADALLKCGGVGRAGLIELAVGYGDGVYQVHDLFDHSPDYVHRRRRREGERRKERRCERCGEIYKSSDERSKFCSSACRTAGWRERDADRQPAAAKAQTRTAKAHLETVLDPVVSIQRTAQPQPSVPGLTHAATPKASPVPAKKAVSGPRFAEFWAAWPSHFRKKGRSKCESKWKKAGLDAIADRVIAGVEAWKRSEQWTKDGGQYMPGPLPWLNDEAWEAVDGLEPAGGIDDIVGADPDSEAARLAASPFTPEEEKRWGKPVLAPGRVGDGAVII